MKDAAAMASTAERFMVGSWSLDERRRHLPKVAPHGALRQERARATDRAEADDAEGVGRTAEVEALVTPGTGTRRAVQVGPPVRLLLNPSLPGHAYGIANRSAELRSGPEPEVPPTIRTRPSSSSVPVCS